MKFRLSNYKGQQVGKVVQVYIEKYVIYTECSENTSSTLSAVRNTSSTLSKCSEKYVIYTE